MILGELSGFGDVTQSVERRRDGGSHGDVLVNDEAAKLFGVEAWHEDQRGPKSEHRIQNNVESIDVVQRQKTADDRLVAQTRGIRADELENVRDQVVMRKQHALGQAGGSAGVGK